MVEEVAVNLKGMNTNVLRTHLAGELRKELTGETVTLTGWVSRRRDHGGVIFIDLRDRSGLAQAVFRESEVAEQAHELRSEFVVKVTGVVEARPEGSENPNLASGEIELNVTELEVLNKSAALPFQIDDPSSSGEVGEEARLRYRYLDLRRKTQGDALRLRSAANRAARRVLDRHEFTEIETPTLTRSTPEGARDFLVPARLKPGSWYALPQSPQLFKQLLMVAGMERYYQLARCYRDEDFRADRQPEFTQLDVEMSFVDQEDVIALGEEIIAELWKLIGYEITTPIPRMTYADAMKYYGTDKPDLRFDIKLVECTDFFKDTTFRVFQNEYVGAVVMEGSVTEEKQLKEHMIDWEKLELEDTAVDEAVNQRLSYQYPYEEAVRSRAKQTVTEIKRQREIRDAYSSDQLVQSFQAPIIKRPNFIQEEKTITGAEKGTIMHTVMQHLPLTRPLNQTEIIAYIENLVEKEMITNEEAQIVNVATIEHFYQTDIAKRMMDAPTLYREIPFSFSLPASEVYASWNSKQEEQVLIQGVIDCLIPVDGGWILLDYKTDMIMEDITPDLKSKLIQRYETQISLYKQAIESIWKQPVKETYLYFFAKQLLVEVL